MATYNRPGVYITERLLPAPIATTGTANAAGAAVGAFAKGPNAVTLVTSWYDFVKKFGGYSSEYPATFGVASFFQNGGAELYVKRVLPSDAAAATHTIGRTGGGTKVGDVTAKNKGDEGNFLRIQWSAPVTKDDGFKYYTLTVYQESAASATDSNADNDVIVETYTNLRLDDIYSSDYAPTVVNPASAYINLLNIAPTTGTDAAVTPVTTRIALTSGTNGSAKPVKTDYVAVFDEFTAIDRPLVVFVPEIINALGSASNASDVFDAAASWAQSNGGFLVADTDSALNIDGTANVDASEAVTYASGITPSTSNAAVYYPNIYISDPLGRSASALRKIGPAGAVAGLYISTDKAVGPFKAPAGLRATIRGAVAVEKSLVSDDLDTLNSATTPVNAIRNLPGAGVVAMGARTLLQDGTANKYVNMRRSLIYIEKSLNNLTQFALFENNDEKLWARLRSVITVFLTGYTNQGGLRGATPAEAFFVKVDAENNPDESIANGEVHIEVGVALQYPAEFVVINLSQKTSA